MRYDIETIIAAAGSMEALAALLKMPERKGYNRVAMWRHRRSIPAAAILKHQPLFDKLMAAKPARARA